MVMAECVVSAVAIAEDARFPDVPACVVHGQVAPCPHWGKPAVAAPLHGVAGTREERVAIWAARTRRQRPLVLHRDVADMDAEDHATGPADTSCPCGAELLPAQEVPVASTN